MLGAVFRTCLSFQMFAAGSTQRLHVCVPRTPAPAAPAPAVERRGPEAGHQAEAEEEAAENVPELGNPLWQQPQLPRHVLR